MNDKRNVLLLYLRDRQIQLQITAIAWWLFRRENTFRRLWRCCFKHFLKYTYFKGLVKVIIRILQPFLCFFFHLDLFIYFFNLLNFYPVTLFLVTPLFVTRYCVTLFTTVFSNTLRFLWLQPRTVVVLTVRLVLSWSKTKVKLRFLMTKIVRLCRCKDM